MSSPIPPSTPVVDKDNVYTLFKQAAEDPQGERLTSLCIRCLWREGELSLSQHGVARFPDQLTPFITDGALRALRKLIEAREVSIYHLHRLQDMPLVSTAERQAFRIFSLNQRLRKTLPPAYEEDEVQWIRFLEERSRQELESQGFSPIFTERCLDFFAGYIRRLASLLGYFSYEEGEDAFQDLWVGLKQMLTQATVRNEIREQWERESWRDTDTDRPLVSKLSQEADFRKAKLYSTAESFSSGDRPAHPILGNLREVHLLPGLPPSKTNLVFKKAPSHLTNRDLHAALCTAFKLVYEQMTRVLEQEASPATLPTLLAFHLDALSQQFILSEWLIEQLENFHKVIGATAKTLCLTNHPAGTLDKALRHFEWSILDFIDITCGEIISSGEWQEYRAIERGIERRYVDLFTHHEQLGTALFALCGVEGRPMGRKGRFTYRNPLGVLHRKEGLLERFVSDGDQLDDILLLPPYLQKEALSQLDTTQSQKLLLLTLLIGHMDAHSQNLLLQGDRLIILDMESILSPVQHQNPNRKTPPVRCAGLALPQASTPLSTALIEEILQTWPFEEMSHLMENPPLPPPISMAKKQIQNRKKWFDARCQTLRNRLQREHLIRSHGGAERLTLKELAFALYPSYEKYWKYLEVKGYPPYFIANWCGSLEMEEIARLPRYNETAHQILLAKGYPEGWIITLLVNEPYMKKPAEQFPPFSQREAHTGELVADGLLDPEFVEVMEACPLFPDFLLRNG